MTKCCRVCRDMSSNSTNLSSVRSLAMRAAQHQASLASCFAGLVMAAAFAGTSPAVLAAAQISLERPGDREFVRDLAEMINSADKEKIRSICDKLLTDKATPVI